MILNPDYELAISRLTPSKYYPLSVKESIIRTVLQGEKSLESIRREFNIAGSSTIQKWLLKIGLTLPKEKHIHIPKYSIVFKKQVVFEVQSGSISAEQARIKYKIGGTTTVNRWCKIYNTLQFIPISNRKVMKDQKKAERDLEIEIKALKQENSNLKLKLEVVETMIDIAEKQLKIDIRKK